MFVLGIDPGTAICGYGLVKGVGNRLQLVDHGALRTGADMPMDRRLALLYDGISRLISLHKPDCLAVEELFFNKNVRTALSVGQARGVVLLAGAKANLPVYEYTPLQVKQAVVGYGRADKNQIQQMVKVLLNLPAVPKPDDVADALAIAICHIHSVKVGNVLEGGRR